MDRHPVCCISAAENAIPKHKQCWWKNLSRIWVNETANIYDDVAVNDTAQLQ